MMRIRILPVLLIVLLSVVVNAQDNLTISGTFPVAMNNRKICLRPVYPYRSDLPNPDIYSESIIRDGKFTLTVPATTLERYMISIKDDANKNRFATFLLLPKKTEIFFRDTLLKVYEVRGNEIDNQERSLWPMMDRRKYTQAEVNNQLISWIEGHPTSLLNTYILGGALLNQVSDMELMRLYNLIPDSAKKNSYGKELKFIVDNLYIGRDAPNFNQTDTSGKVISLSDFRGKYVLIDFWASWCVPCRAENPYLIKAMKKYGGKGFEIISVSLDDERGLWLNAIHKDGLLKWKHVSDLKGWENGISKKYRVRSIPRNFLVDPQGKIIAKNLREKSLLAALSKLFM